MQTLIIGRSSNLSTRLAEAIDSAVLISARELLDGADLPISSDTPCRLVLNNFQAARSLGDLSDPECYVGLSIGVTARLVAALSSLCVRKVIYTSSAAVYGDNVECRETDRPRAAGLHAGLKMANEALVAGVCERLGIDCTLVRLFNMYGGDDRFSVISKIVAAARAGDQLTLVNGGNAIRDFVHVDDVVRVYLALLERTGIPIVNVASGVGVSIRSLLDALTVHGVHIETSSIRRDEIRVSTANVELLSEVVDPATFISAVDFVLSEVVG